MNNASGSDPRTPEKPLITLEVLSNNSLVRHLLRTTEWLLEPVLKFRRLSAVYTQLRADGLAGKVGFFNRALKSLSIEYVVSEKDLERIPKSGPVVIVSNHPYGGLDGIVMGAILEDHRPDNKLLVNGLLDHLEGIRDRCIYVDPFGGAQAQRNNLKGMKSCIQWLKEGGLLATWPAGEVSHFSFKKRRITDPQWADHIINLIERTGATVVPAYFPGRNGLFFQVMGLIHPRLRTLLLPSEMVKRSGSQIELRIGNPISASRLSHFSNRKSKIEFLRLRSYILCNRNVSDKTTFNSLPDRNASEGELITCRVSERLLCAEIDDLAAAQHLAEQGDFHVYYARSEQIPHLMREIGRLREVTFRQVGEGTGKSIDLDDFDFHYIHLFMWNAVEKELVGAYRLGATDEIIPAMGKRGLYTTTLFRYRSSMLKELTPAIELGRSFVVEKYQRKPVSLSLIWKGIGEYIVRNPRYKILFGPVSISKEYESLSKNLIVMYLKENTLDPEYSGSVKAKHPPKTKFIGSLDRNSFKRSVMNIDDVSALISEIEREERGVPVLLKQYLRMNATLLSFNVDPEFNDCIDGLVLVDLSKSSIKTLSRYMGTEGAKSFLDYHEVRQPELV